MKKLFTLILAFCIISAVNAQERFLDEIFTDVTVTTDVEYGVNATVLTLPQLGEAVPESLKLDIYEPTNDTEEARPLVLVFHNGNFLPIVTNGQISGTKQDNSVVDICNSLARRGFVAASVDYRLGWNPFAETQPLRALGIIQAAYRGVQDGRNSVRFFRKTAAEDGNPYRIDTEKITAWGVGTGGYITLAMASLDDYEEITNTTNDPAKFILDLDEDGVPETPMVVEAFHGDINGVVETVTPVEGFGLPAGNTTNISNYPSYSSEVNLTVNIAGALGDLGWLDENTTPIITVQSINDMFAPYGDAVLSVPGQNLAVVQVQGGNVVHERLTELGINDIYNDFSFDKAGAESFTAEAVTNASIAGHDSYTSLYPWVAPANSFGLDEGVVLNWWNAEDPAPLAGMGIPWNMLPHPSGDTFHDQGLFLNEGMSAEKSRANLAKVFGFVLPRASVALDLPAKNLFANNPPPPPGTRYLDEIFADVEITSDVEYGVNATVLTLPQLGEAVPESLLLDIYQPVGDTETNRPLMLVFHNGNFLPIVTNGATAGQKTDNSVKDICTTLAKRGFVAAAVDYRLGWNPFAETQPLRALGIIQAAYRGVQDGRNSVRYFRKTASEDNNPYGIDPNRVTAFGVGTGGYISLAMASLDNYDKITNTTNGPAKFILDLNEDGVPETPMIVETFHGDINGVVETVTPMEGFGLPAGDTTNISNYPNYESNINLSINVGGALGDLSWLDENTAPILTVHSINDMFAPYGDAVLSVPGQNLAVVQVQGGMATHMRLEELGNNDIYSQYDFNQGDFSEITQEAKDNSDAAGHAYFPGLYPWINEPNSNNLDEGVVLNWWNAEDPAPLAGMGIPWNMLPHPEGGTFHERAQITNENMSPEKSRANLDKVIKFVLPRTLVVLDLPGASDFLDPNSVDEKELASDAVKVYPNPASNILVFDTGNININKISIYNTRGALVNTIKVNNTQKNVDVTNLSAGLHFFKVYTNEGVLTKKVMIQK